MHEVETLCEVMVKSTRVTGQPNSNISDYGAHVRENDGNVGSEGTQEWDQAGPRRIDARRWRHPKNCWQMFLLKNRDNVASFCQLW